VKDVEEIKPMTKTLRLILGDQLNINHSWYQSVDDNVVYIMMEVRSETDYVRHHIQKVVAFFSGMRQFSNNLKAQGHKTIYITLDDKDNRQSFTENLNQAITSHNITRFEHQLPDEYRLDQLLNSFCQSLSIDNQSYDTEHFFTTRNELGAFFEGKKSYLLESFYRHLRIKHDLMMDGKEPVSGKWNYDQDNRKKISKNESILEPLLCSTNVDSIVDMLQKHNINTIGNIDATAFGWATNRKQSLDLLQYFTKNLLPRFGKYQDAMTKRSWSLFHSRLSFSLNVKLLSPMEVIEAAISAWKERPGDIDIAQTEGFVRQILGWREYMRGVYWAHMPSYADKNFFNHESKLPQWYWNGKTKMDCLGHAITQSLDYAYAHHIQRLMITGNFALLAGVDPDEIDQWYLGIYIDAIEWVEITNTRGMSQFADGGVVGTKPYVSSANYINKMSHYCKDCYYNPKKKVGERACPFNSLYWHFYARNEGLLKKNPRIGMAYRLWDKMDNEKQKELLDQAEAYLADLDAL